MKAAFELGPPLQQVDRTYVLWRGRKLSYFGGCDYFRLSSHPRIVASVRDGLKKFGLSVSASRITTGNHPLYEELERRVAKFFDVPKAVFVPSGYIANLILAEALAGEFDTVFIDEKAHASLQTAVRQLGCRVIEFPHLNLKKALAGRGSSRTLIATEGLFGANGAVAPLSRYLKTGARVWIDDAHGAGTREPELLGANAIQTVTFSKAFGAYGGAILCSAAIAKKVVGTRLFGGQTPLPLPLACACLEAMDLLKKGSPLRKRLQANLDYMGVSTPIIRVAHDRDSLKEKLLRNRIYPCWVRYPGSPEGYFRFAISGEHSKEQLDRLCASAALR